MKTLADYVEQISDDFRSTFSIQNDNCLVNMLHGETDFPEVTTIIKNYLGEDTMVDFIRTYNYYDEDFDNGYDMYLIKVV